MFLNYKVDLIYIKADYTLIKNNLDTYKMSVHFVFKLYCIK